MSTISMLAGLLLEAVLQSLLLGAAFWLLIAVLCRAFPRSSAAARFLLCNAAQLALLLAFLQPFLPAAAGKVSATSSMSAPSAAVRQVVLVITSGMDGSPAGPMGNPEGQPGAGLPQWPPHSSQWILGLYTAGLLLFSLRFARSYAAMSRLRRRALFLPDERWLSAFGRVKGMLGIRREVRLRFSALVQSPCIIGWARAIVLIPLSLASRLSEEQAEAVLLHELAHYKLLHHYINIAAQAAATLQFFNPFVWLLLRRAARYREWSCDALAAAHSREAALAESLLLIAGSNKDDGGFVLALKQKQSPFYHRIQNLLFVKSTPLSSRGLLLSFILISVSAWACLAQGGGGKESVRRIAAATVQQTPATPVLPAEITPLLLAAEEEAAERAETPAGTGADAPAAAPDSLLLISGIMQSERNVNFLIAEALHDSLLHFDRPLRIAFTTTQILIDDRLVPEPYQSRYMALLKRLPNATQTTFWSSRSEKLTRKDIFDPQSSYRQPDFAYLSVRENGAGGKDTLLDSYSPNRYGFGQKRQHSVNSSDQHGPSKEGDLALKTTIHLDRLADTSKRLAVWYDSMGVKVNGILLAKPLEAKYEALLERYFTHRPAGPGGWSFEITYVPDGEKY